MADWLPYTLKRLIFSLPGVLLSLALVVLSASSEMNKDVPVHERGDNSEQPWHLQLSQTQEQVMEPFG
jgi:hypothetical protein